jgi:uncharacterized membrane protein
MPSFLGILTGLHILLAGLFVGSNVFLDFILTPGMELIPPGQAARLGAKVGIDFAIFSWIVLVGLVASGTGLILERHVDAEMSHSSFYSSGYGVGLMTMMGFWVLLLISATILTFYLRPRVVVKLPYDSTREDVEGGREGAMQAAKWMKILARFNAIASAFVVLVGGTLQ